MTPKFSPDINLNAKTFSLNLTDFRKFLIDNNVTISIVGFAISYYLRDLIDSLFTNVIFCEDNLKAINEYNICIFNIKIYPGKFLISLLKFLVSVLLVFYIARFLNDVVN